MWHFPAQLRASITCCVGVDVSVLSDVIRAFERQSLMPLLEGLDPVDDRMPGKIIVVRRSAVSCDQLVLA